MRPKPDRGAMRWLDAQDPATLFISEVTVGELLQGILLLEKSNDPGKRDIRAKRLRSWLERTLEFFKDATLPVEQATWQVWAEHRATRELQGGQSAGMDSLILAIAKQHGMTLVTRNEADFPGYPLVLNPWSSKTSMR